MFRHGLACLLFLGLATPAWAGWAEGMFDELSRDFGSVPHGHLATHPFRLVNRTGSTVHISSVRVSCGCTSAHALQTTLAPGKDTAILVQMDTRRFYGNRSVTIYVQFDQPGFDEVRLTIHADSRDDVAVIPEAINFGQVKRGAGPAADVTVSFLGDTNWRITGARCDSNYIQLAYRETRRDDGEVAYRVSARLRPDVPAGKWYTDIWLATNNPSMPRLRVPLNVEVAAPTGVSVQDVVLGTVKLGEEIERKVVLRGPKPFRIAGISGTDEELRVQEADAASSPLHVLKLTLRPENTGAFARTIRVRTDLPTARQIELKTQAQVTP